MSIEYTIDHPGRLVTVTARGTLTPEQIFEYQREVWGRGHLAGYDELVDMNDVTEIVADTIGTVGRLASVATAMDPLVGPSRMAVVAAKDYHFGMGRMYKALRERDPRATKRIEVFRNHEAAMAWLQSPVAEGGAATPPRSARQGGSHDSEVG